MDWLRNVTNEFTYSGQCQGFLGAIDLIINRPHLVDKRLSGMFLQYFYRIALFFEF